MSLTYFERALDMMQKKYGHDSAQLISVYQSLGRVSLLASVTSRQTKLTLTITLTLTDTVTVIFLRAFR